MCTHTLALYTYCMYTGVSPRVALSNAANTLARTYNAHTTTSHSLTQTHTHINTQADTQAHGTMISPQYPCVTTLHPIATPFDSPNCTGSIAKTETRTNFSRTSVDDSIQCIPVSSVAAVVVVDALDSSAGESLSVTIAAVTVYISKSHNAALYIVYKNILFSR